MAKAIIAEIKRCPKCRRGLPATKLFFHGRVGAKDGLRGVCKRCSNAQGSTAEKKRLADPDRFAKVRARKTEWQKKWYWQNRRKVLAYWREFRKRPDARVRRSLYLKKRMQNDPVFALKYRAYIALDNALRRRKGLWSHKKKPWWVEALGYTVTDLRRHLEAQFIARMTWKNRKSTWDIDHIKPLALCKATDPSSAEFKKFWRLSNLRPLLKHLNSAKGAKHPA